MAVLYRKYRPQTFAEVLNQKPVIETLKNQVKTGSLAHAYLFTGSRGVGKTSVARILAKAANCLTANQLVSESASQPAGGPADKLTSGLADSLVSGDACGVCEICKQIEAGIFLDLIEIDAASNTGVDNIRELIEHVKFSPSLGKHKVFIIDEVHMLSKGAFNALLKTLEEPPKHAMFILATTEINKVPATIISRTQRFDFKAYSPVELLELLEKISKLENLDFKKEILELVAQNAEGSARDALSLLDKISTLGSGASLAECRQLLGITDFQTCLNLLGLIANGQAKDIPEFYNSLSEQGADYLIFNRDFLEFLRKVLILKITAVLSEDQKDMALLAEKLSTNDIIFIIRLFLKSYKDLPNSPSPQMPLLIASLEAALKKPANQPVSKPVNQLISLSAEPVKVEQPKVESKMVREDLSPNLVVVEENINVHLSEIEEHWPNIIIKIKQINGPLASLLKNTQLMAIEFGRIILGVKFQFDKQSLETPKNFDLICRAITEVSGKKIPISAKVIKAEVQNTSTPTEVLAEALKVFGGELIE